MILTLPPPPPTHTHTHTQDTLAVNSNFLTGSIPKELWSLDGLRKLSLSLVLVFFFRRVCVFFNVCIRPDFLFLSDNELNGTIPTEVGLATNLRT